MMLTKLRTLIFANTQVVIHLVVWTFMTIGIWTITMKTWYHADLPGKIFFTLGYLLFPLVFYVNTYKIIPYFRRFNKGLLYAIFLVLLTFVLEINRQEIFRGLQSIFNTDFPVLGEWPVASLFHGLQLAPQTPYVPGNSL